MNKSTFKIIFISLLSISTLFFSCKTVPKKQQLQLSRKFLDKGQLSADQLATFFIQNNPNEKYKHMIKFASYYIEEANIEGINSDVAFAQMCLETGFLRFGGLVQPEWNNFCGLGSMDASHPGEKFPTEQIGIRAHIQHLQAYATKEDVKLNQDLVDPRYNWVHKTKYIEDIWGLTGTWATDPNYAVKIDGILTKMEESCL